MGEIQQEIDKNTTLSLAQLRLAVEALSVYRELLHDEVIRSLYQLIEESSNEKGSLLRFVGAYSSFFEALCARQKNCNLTEYLLDLVLYQDNAFSRQAEKIPLCEIDSCLCSAVEMELNMLQKIAWIQPPLFLEYALSLCKLPFETSLINALPKWNIGCEESADDAAGAVTAKFKAVKHWEECTPLMAQFYQQNGSGEFARYKGFVWEHSGDGKTLRGVDAPDPICLNELYGYERERGQVVANTEQFLRGLRVNNMLLYGDRGTGKSSTVKALLNRFHLQGLRLVEIPVQYLTDLPQIIRLVKDISLKFIFFIDDLAFEDSEERVTALKAVLEGGIECKPANVVIYATTNRRHLVKENFSDRAGVLSMRDGEEVHVADTMQEKLSLADRFGLTVTFSAPNQVEYLEIVEKLVEQRGIAIEKEQLHKEAVRFEMWYNGRSPRTARQFVDWLEGRQSEMVN